MTITHLSREIHAAREHPRWEERLASAGLPDACVEVRVVDEEGRSLASAKSARSSSRATR